MKRRNFIHKASLSSLGLGLLPQFLNAKTTSAKYEKSNLVTVTKDGTDIHFFSEKIIDPAKITFLSDTHLHKEDERELPYQQFSKRMAGAYNKTHHFQTGEVTHPEEAFENSLKHAKETGSELLVLGGDIFSFPSEASIEWAFNKLEQNGLPYIYVAGNHDWHYEGMKGSMEDLRDEWIEKRLLPLYQGKNPLMASHNLNGIRFVTIDNSTYQISKEQLIFFRNQVEQNIPMVLIMHIPLYAPGKSMGFGCGHPEWGAENDRNFELERRPQWPKKGQTNTTFQFHREVFEAPNLLGVFAGHIHQSSMVLIKGKPQFVADDNASGAYWDVHFNPMLQKDKKLLR